MVKLRLTANYNYYDMTTTTGSWPVRVPTLFIPTKICVSTTYLPHKTLYIK